MISRVVLISLLVTYSGFGQQGTLPPGWVQKLINLQDQFKQLTSDDQKVLCDANEPNRSAKKTKFCSYLENFVDVAQNTPYLAQYVLSTTGARQQIANALLGTVSGDLLQYAENSRTDEQTGASQGATGTTSAVSRVGITDLLNIALEQGAVTQSISGNSITLQANALGLYRFAVGDDVFQYCYDPSGAGNDGSCWKPAERFLNSISGSATLDLTRSFSAAAPVTGSATSSTPASASVLIQNNATHLAAFTIRYEAYNKFNLRNPAYLKAWRSAFSGNAGFLKAGADFTNKSSTVFQAWDPISTNWRVTIAEKLQESFINQQDLTSIEQTYAMALDTLVASAKAANLIKTDDLTALLDARATFLSIRDAALDKLKKQYSTGLSFEYTNSHPAMQPRQSNFKAIVAFHPPSTNAHDTNFTLNIGADLYDTLPAGAKTGKWRDVQVALQLDRKLGNLANFGPTTFTLGGYFQYQREASLIQTGTGNVIDNTGITLPGPTATLLATKGNIGVVQAMFTTTLKSGAKVPYGFTWSNRTELIKGNEVRGHIGFTFDWDSLFSGAKN